MTFVVLTSGTLTGLLNAAVAPSLPIIARHFGGHGIAIAQFLDAAAALGVALGGIPAGALMDRVGPRLFLFAMLGLYALMGSAGFYLDNYRAIIATRFILGLAAVGVTISSVALISERFSPEARPRLLGYQAAIGAVAGVLFLLATGALSERAGWRVPFLLYLLSLPILFVATRSVPERKSIPFVSSGASSRTYLNLIGPCVLIIVVFIADYMVNIQLPFLGSDPRISQPTTASILIGLSAISMSAGALSFGAVSALVPVGWLPTLFLLIIAAGEFVIGTVGALAAIAFGAALIGFGGGLAVPNIYHVVASTAVAGNRGRAIAFASSSIALGGFLNPVVITPLRESVGVERSFVFTGLFLTALAVFVFVQRMGREFRLPRGSNT